MQLSDIIALAKAGYKPADVREFLAEGKTPEVQPAPAEDPQPGQDPEPSKDQPAGSQDDAGAPAEYIQQINELTEANKKLMEQLKNLQAANSRQAMPDGEKHKSDQDILNDMARSFM